MKTVLIFVLSAHFHPYGKMIQTAMDTWDAEPLEGTRTVYYCGNPIGGDTDRVISFPVDEDYKTMGHKNIFAYTKALEWKWDYMGRVNASCYVHKRRLLERVQTLPDTGVMQGLTLGPTIYCGVQRDWMWGGGQFIFSRDVIEAFVNNSHKWRHDVMEDVASSELAQECGFKLDSTGLVCSINQQTNDRWMVTAYNGLPGFEFSDWHDVAKVTDQYFFRVKHDPDRSVDHVVMRLLKQHLPP